MPLACAASRDSFSASTLGAADDAPPCSSLSRTALVQLSCRGRLRVLQGIVLRGTFNPQSRFRASWDMLLLLAVMYITVVLPLQAWPYSRHSHSKCRHVHRDMHVGFEPDLDTATTNYLQQSSHHQYAY